MSDTPRINAARNAAMEHMTGDVWRVGCQLERELNAANAEIERLTDKVAQLYEGAEEQNQRIKRLEEAGDRMRLFCADSVDCFAWDKAKEYKP